MQFPMPDIWKKLMDAVSAALTDSGLYMELHRTDRGQAERAIRTFAEMKDMAALGDRSARDRIHEYILTVLSETRYAAAANIALKTIDFQNLAENCAPMIFELLLANRMIGALIDKYAVESRIDEELLRHIALTEETEDSYLIRYQEKQEQLRFIAGLLYAATYGQDCIESLQFQDINEIGVLNKDYIYISYKGRKFRLSFLSFETGSMIINIQKKTTQNSALNFDRQNPIIVTAKLNASRISAAGYDVTPGAEDIYYNERIFQLKAISLEDMRDRYHTIDEALYALLQYNQKGRGSFLVTGSDMGVGKSTFLLSMLEKYPDNWGIGILDPQNELQAGKKYPEKNVLTLVENDKKNLSQCFAYLLKTSRDVMVVSEITMPEEVSELVNAALRLNAGVCATMHSLSPYEVVPNLRNLMLKTEMYQDRMIAEEDIAGSIDLLIHLSRLPSGRIIVEAVYELYIDKPELCSAEADLLHADDRTLRRVLLRVGAQALLHKASGRQYILRPLIRYDTKGDRWNAEQPPSEQYLTKMKRYAGEAETERIRGLFV